MAEKLVITLTDRDITLSNNDEKGKYFFETKCPLCNQTILITRIKGACCRCDIEWHLDMKIKGVRSHTDEDRKQQFPLPFKTTA